MLETMTTQKISHTDMITLVSSSKNNGDAEFLIATHPLKRGHTKSYISCDTASYVNLVILNFRSETFGDVERPIEEMLEHDIVVNMPAQNSFTIQARITRISKAEPQIFVDAENTYLES